MLDAYFALEDAINDLIDEGLFPQPPKGGLLFRRACEIKDALLRFRPELDEVMTGAGLAAALKRHPRIRWYRQRRYNLYATKPCP